MKKKIYSIVLIITVMLTHYSCEFGVEEEEIPEINDVTLTGQIVESITGNPIFNASVKITDGITQVNTTTNSDGKFTSTFSLAEDGELTVIAFKEGYSTDTLKFFATVGSDVTVPLIRIKQIQGTGETSSGGAASVYMFSQSSQSIGVKESGANETAQIIFEVLDSTGVPINSDNAVSLVFRFGASPNGGEYLYPASVQTNALGRAVVTLNTGTIAGVAQVIAEMVVNNVTIRSKPVLISIHGGFPDQNHFFVGAEKLNYPVCGIFGYEILIGSLVGDKYTNPVRPGTSVYFSTTSGVIQGSNLTDDLGRAPVTLLTGECPNNYFIGPGFLEVTATTIDENQQNIFAKTVILLSGITLIYDISPGSFNIVNGGSEAFSFRVSDANGNPLAEETNISVSVTEGDVTVTGDVDVTLRDTQDPSFTFFSFTASDSEPDEDNPNAASITISVSSPNGNSSITIYGTAR